MPTPVENYPHDIESDVFKRWLNRLAKSARDTITSQEGLVLGNAWALYADQGHDQSDPQILLADTPVKLFNDGAGAGSDLSQLQEHTFYDLDTQVLKATTEGHLHLIELDFIGDAGSPALQYIVEGRGKTSGQVLNSRIVNFTKGGNNPHKLSVMSMIPFTPAVFAEGGMEIWITCDSNVELYGVTYMTAHTAG